MSSELGEKTYPERVEQTWRAYAVVEVAGSGITSYLECQLTPDGQAYAFFIGAVGSAQATSGIASIKALVGGWVVSEPGETSPVLAADGWRLAMRVWWRGSLLSDVGMTQAPAGQEYVAVIADVANWRASTDQFGIGSVALHMADGGPAIAPRPEQTVRLAASLGELPADATTPIAIPAGESRRFAFVFLVPASEELAAVSLGAARAVLPATDIVPTLQIVPPARALPVMETGTITSVIDGRTVRVLLDETGKQVRVRLIGLAGQPDEEAESRLASFLGQSVLLEADPADPDDARLKRYVWVDGNDGVPLLLNDALIEEGLMTFEPGTRPTRFDGMLGVQQGLPASAAGAVDPAAGDGVAGRPSEADIAYLTSLQENASAIEDVMFMMYDRQIAAPVLDDTFYGGMVITFLFWASAYDTFETLTPTAAYFDLHTSLLDALRPFHDVAHHMEPNIDRYFAGEVDGLGLPNFDYDLLVATVDTARPELERVLAEVDQALVLAGIEGV